MDFSLVSYPGSENTSSSEGEGTSSDGEEMEGVKQKEIIQLSSGDEALEEPPKKRTKPASVLGNEMEAKRDDKKKEDEAERILKKTCKECGKVYSSGSKMRLHFRTKHEKSKSKQFKCSICNAGYAAPYRLRDHMLSTHTEEFNHKCKKCGKGFLRPGAQRKHENKCVAEDEDKDEDLD